MSMFKVLTHPRTGTHLLMKLLHLNFETNAHHYRAFVGNHFAPWEFKDEHVGVVRNCMPTLQSLWQLRERFGVWRDVDFPMFISTPWPDLPRSQECQYVFDGKEKKDANHQMAFSYWDTPVATWLWVQKHVWRNCIYTSQYDNLVSNPLQEVEKIAFHTGAVRKPEFTAVPSKVGYWSPKTEAVEYGEPEAALIAAAQHDFDEFVWDISRSPPFDHEDYEWVRNWRRGQQGSLGSRKKSRRVQKSGKQTSGTKATPTLRRISGPARQSSGDSHSTVGRKVIIKGKTIIKRRHKKRRQA